MGITMATVLAVHSSYATCGRRPSSPSSRRTQRKEALTNLVSAFTHCSSSIYTVPNNGAGLGGHLLARLEDLPTQKPSSLHLPDLETFKFGALDDISAPESLAASNLDLLHLPEEPEEVHNIEDEAFWSQAQRDGISKSGAAPTWERFRNENHEEPSPYLSEAGPLAFTAALQHLESTDRRETPSKQILVKTEPLMKDLFLLGLGVESLFFMYDKPKKRFRPRFDNVTLPGLSTQLIGGLASEFIEMANDLHFLDYFVEKSYQTARSSSTRIALADCVRSVVFTLRSVLSEDYETTRSLLQLRHNFQKPRAIVRYIVEVIEHTRNLTTPEQILTKVFYLTQESEFKNAWVHKLMLEILSRTSVPWLESIAACVGLRSMDNIDETQKQNLLGHAEKSLEGDATAKSSDIMPSFIGTEEEEKIVQTTSGLQMLKDHHEDHILAKPGRNQFTQGPGLEWRFGWADIDRVQRKAKDYEERIRAAMKANMNYATQPVDDCNCNRNFCDPYGKSESDIKRQFGQSLTLLETISSPRHSFKTSLERTLRSAVSTASTIRPTQDTSSQQSSFAPPLGLCPALSFNPLLTTQAKLVNHAALRMLFQQHHLSSHLSLQHSFQLLGSGLFSTRLSTSLFSPNLHSAERRAGHVRSHDLGLRLSARDTWPPASSELQLALAGVLVDSYHDDEAIAALPHSVHDALTTSADLPGGLSFAIRSLDEDGIKSCLDPHSLYALDFLRLQYKPIAPLDAVISEASLDKYDRIFKLLLRVQRLLFVTGRMARLYSARRSRARRGGVESRFRVEALHFVSTIADYFFHVAIGTTWIKFWNRVEDLEGRLMAEDGFEKLAGWEGIYQLREMHEKMLDNMLFGLLLRNRQVKVMALLEEILSCVLKFARTMDLEDMGVEEGNTKETYDYFEKKVQVFVAVCRGLSGRVGYGSGNGSDRGMEENTIEQLVLRLDMNGWYSKS
jgi:hypothetical protein